MQHGPSRAAVTYGEVAAAPRSFFAAYVRERTDSASNSHQPVFKIMVDALTTAVARDGEKQSYEYRQDSPDHARRVTGSVRQETDEGHRQE